MSSHSSKVYISAQSKHDFLQLKDTAALTFYTKDSQHINTIKLALSDRLYSDMSNIITEYVTTESFGIDVISFVTHTTYFVDVDSVQFGFNILQSANRYHRAILTDSKFSRNKYLCDGCISSFVEYYGYTFSDYESDDGFSWRQDHSFYSTSTDSIYGVHVTDRRKFGVLCCILHILRELSKKLK